MKRSTFRRALVASATLLAFIAGQETWALAGTTGGIAGFVKDSTSGAPIAGARVQAVAPSQTANTTTDAGGHFIILSLAPDTYTITVSKAGYQQTSSAGEVVFADQTQRVAIGMTKQLATIAHVTAQGGGSLVKSGVGGDLYSVNSAQAHAASPLGGGGNLNSAYSAMSSVPGVQVNVGGQGWTFNAAYVRGQNYYYTGYEYDGIPINRAFDNYNASTESSLGLQELQVYTGGGPSSVATAGTAGFINQVIKSGTYPGFAQANLGIGTPTFYHYGQVEVGGSTPDRNFSYYAAFNGTNQAFRLIDSDNGAGFMEPGGIYSGAATIGLSPGYTGCTGLTGPTCQGVKPSCAPGVTPADFINNNGIAQGCWGYYSGLGGTSNFVTDRENVVNFHLGLPRQSGLRDDVQLLWSGSHLNNGSYGSINDLGPGYQQFYLNNYFAPYAAPVCNQPITFPVGLTVNGCVPSSKGAYTPYADQIAYNVPFGTPVATATHTSLPSIYFAPATPQHQFDAPIPLFDEGLNSYQNDTGIVKLQYTHALSQAAYVRVYGYTFYSDWLQTAPLSGATDQTQPALPSPEYDLITHTSGGAVEFNDQINDQNLLGADVNYTQANVTRFNNTSALAGQGTSPIGYMSGSGNNFTCYDAAPASAGGGKAVPCLSSAYYDVALRTLVNPNAVYSGAPGSCDTPSQSNPKPAPCGWRSNAIQGPTGFSGPSNASWDSLWTGNATGSFNTVQPHFTNAAISDQWRPNDRILLNASMRYDNFTYDLPDSATAATQFYANMTANYTCVQASTNQVFVTPLTPGEPPPATAQYINGDCNQGVSALTRTTQKGWVHPNGKVQDGIAAPNFTAASPSSYGLNYWEPRFSATYTINPETVLRASAGRYVAPPISASVQYLALTGDDRSVWNNTLNLGFYTPFHPIPGISSAQYDMSLEKHLHGTDMSFKVTPYFTWVNDWQQQTFLGSNFVTNVPVGVNRDYGVEFQFNKGDFTRDGFSGQFSLTYTNSKVQFQNVGIAGGIVPNQTIALNTVIAQYNALTKSGGGSPCYLTGLTSTLPYKGVSCAFKGSAPANLIRNPYYNMPAQGELDPNGWYNPYITANAPNLNAGVNSYISPLTSALILNYRHHKLAITPSVQFQSGGFYGSPLDVNGYDPRTCGQNSLAGGVTKLSPKTNPLQCNVLSLNPGVGSYGPLGYLYIPNPQTGVFSALGSYEQPSLITGNLMVTYEATPRMTVTLTGTNLFHSCFGGSSEPWTQAFGPSPNVCGYAAAGGAFNSSIYPSNFYNGTGINDKAANKVVTPFQQSYFPTLGNNGGIGSALPPFNVYLTAQFKI